MTAPNSSEVATGKVKVVVKRGSKTVKSTKLTLKNGAVTKTFSGLNKKAKYKVTVTYLGTANFSGSAASASKKI